MSKVGLIKQYDLDLKLYQDFCKTLDSYRKSLIYLIGKDTYKDMYKRDLDLKRRLSERLNIKILDL